MSNAYRTHYLPAAQQLVPGADPYILSLFEGVGRPTVSRATTSRRLERHAEALSASFDPRRAEAFVIAPPPSDGSLAREERRRSPLSPTSSLATAPRHAWTRG